MMATIERADLSHQVYERLRSEIVQGQLRDGDRLHIDRLAARLDVSPTPVKTALARLASEGLVESRRRGGAYVTRLSQQEITEIFEIREMIEQYAAARALGAATEEHYAHLSGLNESLRNRIYDDGTADVEGFAADDMAFHASLVGLSGNRRLVTLYESLHVYTMIARAHAVAGAKPAASQTESSYYRSYVEHLAIIDALRGGDTNALRATMGNHLRQAREFVLSVSEPAAEGRPQETAARLEVPAE
jgi:GntR family transcriptional regulator, rspAB operon transcriptional repressor